MPKPTDPKSTENQAKIPPPPRPPRRSGGVKLSGATQPVPLNEPAKPKHPARATQLIAGKLPQPEIPPPPAEIPPPPSMPPPSMPPQSMPPPPHRQPGQRSAAYSITEQISLDGPLPPPPPPSQTTGWQSLPLFSGLDDDALGRFKAAMEPVQFKQGDVVLQQGEPGDHMYVLESGKVRVVVRGAEQVVVFERIIEAPAIFGEMALITKEPRTATIMAVNTAHCLRLSKPTISELFSRHPNTAVFLTRLVGERLMETSGIRKVGKYEVVGRLGSGGVATVFEARHPTLHLPVALKMLSHALVFDDTFSEHFDEEARLVASLDHDNIVRVLDIEQAYGTKFIVMEKLTGELLETLIDNGTPLDWQNVRRIIREICGALAYSHQHGLIHRDIKPANVFLLADGKVKLLDFGIATKPGGTAGGKIIGTPYYMSPEQICNLPVDGRSDLYSLGILAYELICRSLPFDGDTLQELLARHIQEPIPDVRPQVPGVPEDLAFFVEKCCAKRPEQRFADCLEAQAYLKAAAEVPVLNKFAMSALSVTYHPSKRALVEQVLADASRQLQDTAGIAFFLAHRDPSE